MNRKIFYFSLLSVAVASCGTVNNKLALGDFEYTKQKQGKALEIPNDLDKPNTSTEYFITDNINRNGPIGANVDVRSPSLVLPIAASTRSDSNLSAAKVWFDQVLEDVDLKTFVIDAIKTQLAEDNVSVSESNPVGPVLKSDWYTKEVISGVWPFKSVDSSESIRYQYVLESKPHGRSVALQVTLAEYMKTDSSGGSKTIDLIEQQRAEMAMLNKIISQVDYQYRLQQRENRLLRANKKFVTVGENSASEAAYIVEISADLLWSNLPLFFADHGFSITDLNESDKIYYVDYVKPEIGFWDSIWGDDKPVAEIPDGKYQFKLAEVDERSIVTIYDEQGNALSADVLNQIFNVMGPGLSFKDAF